MQNAGLSCRKEVVMISFTLGRFLNGVDARLAKTALALALLPVVGLATASDLAFLEFHSSGVAGVTDLAHPNSCDVSRNGESVYFASNASHAVVHFERDPLSGRLTFVGSYVDGTGSIVGLHNCASVAISPDGANVYTAAQGDDAIAVFDREPAGGDLTWVEVHFDGVAGVDGLDRVFDVMVSPDGKNVYAGAIDDDAVAVFARDPATGRLTFMEVHVNGVGGVSGLGYVVNVGMDSQGAHLYAAAKWSHAVAVFSRDPVSGALTFVDSFSHPDLQGTSNVGIGPADASVYVSSSFGDSLLVLARDPVTGLLTHVETHTEGIAGVTNIAGPQGVIVDPGGGLVGALSADANAIAVFRRDASTGRLEYAGAEIDGVDGVDGLADPNAGCVDALGRSVYVAAWDDNAVSVFSLAVFIDDFEAGDTSRWTVP